MSLQAGLGTAGQNHALQVARQAFLAKESHAEGQNVQEALSHVLCPWRHHAVSQPSQRQR